MAKKITKKELDLMLLEKINLQLDILDTLISLRMTPSNKVRIFTKIQDLKSSVQILQKSISK